MRRGLAGAALLLALASGEAEEPYRLEVKKAVVANRQFWYASVKEEGERLPLPRGIVQTPRSYFLSWMQGGIVYHYLPTYREASEREFFSKDPQYIRSVLEDGDQLVQDYAARARQGNQEAEQQFFEMLGKLSAWRSGWKEVHERLRDLPDRADRFAELYSRLLEPFEVFRVAAEARYLGGLEVRRSGEQLSSSERYQAQTEAAACWLGTRHSTEISMPSEAFSIVLGWKQKSFEPAPPVEWLTAVDGVTGNFSPVVFIVDDPYTRAGSALLSRLAREVRERGGRGDYFDLLIGFHHLAEERKQNVWQELLETGLGGD